MKKINKWFIDQYEAGVSVGDAIKAFDNKTALERKEIRGTNDDSKINSPVASPEENKKERGRIYQAVRRHKGKKKTDGITHD